MSDLTRAVVRRFPSHELAIARLFRSDEAFRSMCEDYADGIAALTAWQRAADTQLQCRIVELGASLAELEEEILQELERASSQSE